MAFPTFVPPHGVNISPGSSVEFQPRVRRADFGDGYSQRAGDGLNTLSRKVEANFQVLYSDEAEAIITFFTNRRGYLPFMWTLPGETSPRQWIAPSWRRTYSDTKITDVTASLEETFDPA